MFNSNLETKIGEEFVENGFVIRQVANQDAFDRINDIFFHLIQKKIGFKIEDREHWFNNTHNSISVDELNTFRLDIINGINADPNFRLHYFNLARPYLELLVGNELAMQMRVNLSIQYPGDDSSLLPIHADTWSGDSAFEVVVWTPLVDCFKTKSMFLLNPHNSVTINSEFTSINTNNSEELFQAVKRNLSWLEIKRGQVLIFNQALPHGNRMNEELETRWSLNCRFKAVFTPYADKKLGEFFEPITLKPVSQFGLNYKLPKIK